MFVFEIYIFVRLASFCSHDLILNIFMISFKLNLLIKEDYLMTPKN